MSVSIQRKGDRLYVVCDLPRQPGGGRRQKWIPAGTSITEARKLRNKIARELDQGRVVDDRNLRLGEFLGMWLEEQKANIRESTWTSYKNMIESHILPHLGHTKLRAIRPLHIQEFCSHMLKSGRRKGEGGLSPTTVRYIYVILHTALKAAVNWEVLPSNPADPVTPPSPAETEMQYWNKEQVNTFLKAIRDTDYYELYLAAIHTGLRRGELLGLKWDDLDLDNGKLTVRRAVVQSAEGKIITSEPKTRGGRRTISISRGLCSAFRSLEKRQKEMRLKMGPDYGDSDKVFRQPNGKPLRPHGVTLNFKRLVEKVEGVPRIRFHDLRHTHATLMLSQGEHPKVVAERLGHARVTTTLDTYSHVIPALQDDAADKLEANLDISRPEC